jgi:GntR family transcriptional repressor for pyruvate dehydrogenase complex
VERAPDKELMFDRLLGKLRERIAAGENLPPERTLVGQLGVKRHTLRKALEHLRSVGELGLRPATRPAAFTKGGQALVRSTNPIEVIEMRLALEPILARLAALRATPTDIARIERAATTLSENDSASADLAFHKAIAAATGNTLAASIYALLRQVGADARIYIKAVKQRPMHRLTQRDDEHRRIAQAIANRDADGAERAMRAHLHMVQRQILDQISLNPGHPTYLPPSVTPAAALAEVRTAETQPQE